MKETSMEAKSSMSGTSSWLNDRLELYNGSIIAGDVKLGHFNGDGYISMVDVVGIVNTILKPADHSTDINAKRSKDIHSNDCLKMSDAYSETGNVSIPVSMENSTAYTAFQMDVELPEGATFTSATLGSRATNSHTIRWEPIADDKVRIIAYSLTNATFTGNVGELITLGINAADGTNGIVTVMKIN